MRLVLPSIRTLDDADELVYSIAVLARETHEIPRLRDDDPMLGGPGVGDAAATAELEHPFVPQLPQCAQDGVRGHGAGYRGRGVHEAARIDAVAEAGEILASSETVSETRFPVSEARRVTVKGLSQPLELVSVDWR
jgi:hypothetical protein